MLEKDDLPLESGLKNGKGHGLHGSIEGVSDFVFSMNQFKQTMREILIEFFGEMQEQIQDQRQWYDTDPAYKLLGLNDSEQLRSAVRCGLLRIGHEVRDRRKPKAKLPRYQFHIEKCQKRLLERPEQRKKV